MDNIEEIKDASIKKQSFKTKYKIVYKKQSINLNDYQIDDKGYMDIRIR